MQAHASDRGNIVFSLRLEDQSVSKERCFQEDFTEMTQVLLRLVQNHRSADAVKLSSEASIPPITQIMFVFRMKHEKVDTQRSFQVSHHAFKALSYPSDFLNDLSVSTVKFECGPFPSSLFVFW